MFELPHLSRTFDEFHSCVNDVTGKEHSVDHWRAKENISFSLEAMTKTFGHSCQQNNSDDHINRSDNLTADLQTENSIKFLNSLKIMHFSILFPSVYFCLTYNHHALKQICDKYSLIMRSNLHWTQNLNEWWVSLTWNFLDEKEVQEALKIFHIFWFFMFFVTINWWKILVNVSVRLENLGLKISIGKKPNLKDENNFSTNQDWRNVTVTGIFRLFY